MSIITNLSCNKNNGSSRISYANNPFCMEILINKLLKLLVVYIAQTLKCTGNIIEQKQGSQNLLWNTAVPAGHQGPIHKKLAAT